MHFSPLLSWPKVFAHRAAKGGAWGCLGELLLGMSDFLFLHGAFARDVDT